MKTFSQSPAREYKRRKIKEIINNQINSKMADKRKLLELDIDVQSIISKAAQLKETLDQLRETQDKLKKSGDTSSETYVKNAALISKVSAEYGKNQQVLTAMSNVSGQYLSIQQKINLATEKEITSIASARANNTELLKVRNELNLKTVEGAKAAAAINQKLDENNNFIKENSSQYEKQKINIGNYKDSITSALQETNIFGGTLSTVTTAFAPFSGAFQLLKQDAYDAIQQMIGNATATEGMSRAQAVAAFTTNAVSGALKLLRVALIGTGIGAIVIAIGSLIAYLSTTQAGIDKVTSVTRPLQAIFSALMGVLSNLGGLLVDTFSNPKKAMEDLGNFVKTNLINRFKAFGVILEGIMELDFKKVSNGVLQAGTGVENLTDKISNGAKAAGKFLDDNAKKGAELDRTIKQIEKSQLAYNAAQVAVGDAIDKQLLISKDTSKSFAERGAAAKEIIRITEENGKAEAEILQLKLKQLQIEQSLKGTKNLTKEDKQATIDLLTKIDEAEDRGLNARLEQSRVLSGLKKEEQANNEAAAKKNEEIRQKALDDATAKLKLELDLYLQTNAKKSTSISSELKNAETLRDKKLEIAKAEFEASKKTNLDQLNYLKNQNDAKAEFADMQLEAVSKYAKAEFDLFISENRSKLAGVKELTQSLIDEEAVRLEKVRAEKVNQLELEKNTNQQVIDAKRAANEELSVADLEYLTARNDIELEAKKQLEDNKAAFDEQVKQRKAEQLAIDREVALAESQTQYEDDILIAEQKNADELARFRNLLEDKKITQDQYNILEKEAISKMAQAKEIARLEEVDRNLNGANKMIGDLQALFGKNKAFAAATALVNGGLAVTSILAQYPKFDGGFAMWASIAAAGITTVKSLAQINKAKLAKGGVLQGPSHDNGGIPFTVDGKAGFEAEGDEIVLTKGVYRNPYLRSIASKINAMAGGVKFAKGGPAIANIESLKELTGRINYSTGSNAISFAGGNAIHPSTVVNNATQVNNSQIDYDLLAGKIGEHVANANLNLPAPIVYAAVTDINTGQKNYAQVVEGANL